ncbi:MAG: hypothetical protein GY950_32080 [bacterium]|nr:hypothetical protein [bacterium]
MFKQVFGFLGRYGWAGVELIFYMVAVCVTVGMSLLYFFLIYKKDPMPRRISITGNVVKIIILLTLAYFLWVYTGGPID